MEEESAAGNFNCKKCCQEEFFQANFTHWRNDKQRKSGKYVACCRNLLCKPGRIKLLYFGVVEKSVDNVEKCELSTDITALSTNPSGAYFPHNFAHKQGKTVAFLCYVAMGIIGFFQPFLMKKLANSINRA